MDEFGERMTKFFRNYIVVAILGAAACSTSAAAAYAQTKIVTVGASNTSGFGVGSANAFPAQLEAMLKARGYNVQIINAGIPGQTTSGMLARIDGLVPAGTKIVIIQPGGNDARFGVPPEIRAKNIREMVARLRKRGVRVIVADNLQGLLTGNSFDGIHFNTTAHRMIAKKLYSQVVGALGGSSIADNKAAAASHNMSLNVQPSKNGKVDVKTAPKQ